MAESGEISMERWLDVALNPIGSLALVERFDENKASLLKTFNILSSKIVDLILSPYGFRIVESFLNVDLVYERLAKSLSEDWSGLEKVLRTEKGRYVCETLLKKDMKLFAHRIIAIAPRNWWFKNVEALTILIKAITSSDVDIANLFISNEQMVIDLCDSPEGLYCVLKVMTKSTDQPGWKDALANLILLKSKSTAGCEALAQAILYGDYFVNEIVEIICRRRESIDNSTVSLIIRIIEHGSASVKELIVKCLCETIGNPVISQIRDAKQFANFTPSQRKRLDDCLAASRVRSIVDDCVTTLATNESDSLSTPDAQNKKRRSESNVTSQSAAKKPREEDAEPQPSSSKTTVPPLSTVTTPAAILGVSTVTVPAAIPPVTTVSLPPKVSSPSTVPPISTATMLPAITRVSDIPLPPTAPLPRASTKETTILSVSTIPLPPTVPSLPAVTKQPTVASSATVPIPTTTPAVKPSISSLSATIPHPPSVPAVPVDRLLAIEGTDPGKDVVDMAMSEKYRSLLSKMAKGTPKLRTTVFNCIRNALLPLMMDERGSEVVKWFIVNGTPKQKEEIERKVEDNMEDLVTNGGYGRTIAQLAIDNCADLEKKKELSEKSMKAMESPRDSPSPSPVNNNDDEVEIVSQKINKRRRCNNKRRKSIVDPFSQKINKKPADKSTVAEASLDMSLDISLDKIDMQPIDKSSVAKVTGVTDGRERAREPTIQGKIETSQLFDEIDDKMRQQMLSGTDIELYVSNAARLAKDGVSQLFIDLVQERVAAWAVDDSGTMLLKGFVDKRQLRVDLVYAVASVLHLLNHVSGPAIVKIMLLNYTRTQFSYYCISKHKDSPIAKLFRADMATDRCLMIGMEFVKVFPARMRDWLASPTGCGIADTENGRRFIELLAKPRPEGRAWVDLLHMIPAAPNDRIPHKSTVTVNIETGETSSNNKSSVEEQTIAADQPTVVPSHEDTVASRQSDTVATPVETTALNSNDDRWRHVLREENGVVSIVQGRHLSNEERLRIIEMCDEVNRALRKGWPSSYQKKAFLGCGMLKDGVSQLFIDEIQSRMARNQRWIQWMSDVAQRTRLRPYLVVPVASVLARMPWPSALLDIMLLKGTQEAFINACLEGDDQSPFVRLFHSDVQSESCVRIGVLIAKTRRDRFHSFLASPHGRSIGESENGRRLIEWLAKPHPEGCGWKDLLGIEMATSDGAENRLEVAIATARSTVVPPHQNTVSSSQMATVASTRQNTGAPPKNEPPSIFRYVYSKLFS